MFCWGALPTNFLVINYIESTGLTRLPQLHWPQRRDSGEVLRYRGSCGEESGAVHEAYYGI